MKKYKTNPSIEYLLNNKDELSSKLIKIKPSEIFALLDIVKSKEGLELIKRNSKDEND